MPFSLDTTFIEAVAVGGISASAAFVVAIYQLLRKQAKANGAEGGVYDLLQKEVTRLSAALAENDVQMQTLRREHSREIAAIRAEHAKERAKCDMDIEDLRTKLFALEEKLLRQE